MKTPDKPYYYSDKWSGEIRHFTTLEAARRHARKNNAGSVPIYGHAGAICFVEGSLPILA